MQCKTFPPRWQKLLLICLFLATALPEGMAQVLQAAKKSAVGIITYRSRPGGLDEFAEAVYFREFHKEPLWMAIDVGGTKALEVGRDCVAATVYFDQALTMDLVDSSGRAVLVKTREELAAMAKQFPKSEPLARPVITAIESSITKMDQGEVRRDGQWVNVVAENKAKQTLLERRLKRLATLKNAAPGRFIIKETPEQAMQRFAAPDLPKSEHFFFYDRDYLFVENFLDGKVSFIKVTHKDHSPFANEELDALRNLAGTGWQVTENEETWKVWRSSDGSGCTYSLPSNDVVFHTLEWTAYSTHVKAEQEKAAAAAATPARAQANAKAATAPHPPRATTRHQVILEARAIAEKEWPDNYELQLSRIEGIFLGWKLAGDMVEPHWSTESNKRLANFLSEAEDRWGWDYEKINSEMSKAFDGLVPEAQTKK